MIHGVSTPAPFGAGVAWCYGYAVAPHAGAWIETWWGSVVGLLCLVAPHAGAWIETSGGSVATMGALSPLMQGRGLKLADPAKAGPQHQSPLMQGRGLKLKTHHRGQRGAGRPSCRGVD